MTRSSDYIFYHDSMFSRYVILTACSRIPIARIFAFLSASISMSILRAALEPPTFPTTCIVFSRATRNGSFFKITQGNIACANILRKQRATYKQGKVALRGMFSRGYVHPPFHSTVNFLWSARNVPAVDETPPGKHRARRIKRTLLSLFLIARRKTRAVGRFVNFSRR